MRKGQLTHNNTKRNLPAGTSPMYHPTSSIFRCFAFQTGQITILSFFTLHGKLISPHNGSTILETKILTPEKSNRS